MSRQPVNREPADYLPTLLGLGASAVGTYFLSNYVCNKLNEDVADPQFFTGAGALNNGCYPGVEIGTGSMMMLLTLISVLSPRLFDFILSKLNRSGSYDLIAESDNEGTALISPERPRYVGTPLSRTLYTLPLYVTRLVSFVLINAEALEAVAIHPAGDAYLRFKATNDDQANRHAETLAEIGIRAIPVEQFFTMLATIVLLTYSRAPRERAEARTWLQWFGRANDVLRDYLLTNWHKPIERRAGARPVAIALQDTLDIQGLLSTDDINRVVTRFGVPPQLGLGATVVPGAGYHIAQAHDVRRQRAAPQLSQVEHQVTQTSDVRQAQVVSQVSETARQVGQTHDVRRPRAASQLPLGYQAAADEKRSRAASQRSQVVIDSSLFTQKMDATTTLESVVVEDNTTAQDAYTHVSPSSTSLSGSSA